jgi:ribonuclease R
VTVRLAEAVPVTGGLILELLEIEGGALPRGGQGQARAQAAAARRARPMPRGRPARRVVRKRR